MNKMFKIITLAIAGASFSSAMASPRGQCQDIVDTAVSAGKFTTLAAALGAANLVDTLKSEGPFTVFAPLDSAFAKLPAGTVDSLLKDIPALTNILTYHVLAGEVVPASLLRLGTVKTLQGTEVNVEKRGRKLFINESEVVSIVRAANGIIYVIDSVLLPASN